MKKLSFLFFATAILHQTNFAQTSFQISSFNATSEDFKLLLLNNKEIDNNDTVNEKILDLVEPMLLDSVVEKKRQHHRVFLVGWLIHAFGGYNWRAVNLHKQKFVGTVEHHGRSGAIEYSEYDINFDYEFHLDKYLNKSFASFDLQKKYHRQDIRKTHRTGYSLEPFVRDLKNLDMHKYKMESELTPPYAFLPQLNYLFYPTIPGGGGLKEHPNFGTAHPTMGFYGLPVLDCNHNCHPEIHPYEWTWWLNLQEQNSTDKTWLIGLFHESSNRFPNWSTNPMTGEIKIPFAFEKKIDFNHMLQINVEHLVFSKFENEELKKIELPNETFGPQEKFQSLLFQLDDTTAIEGTINFNQVLKTDGLKYWFTDLNFDEQLHVLSGYLHYAVSVKDLYTTKITFGEEYGD